MVGTTLRSLYSPERPGAGSWVGLLNATKSVTPPGFTPPTVQSAEIRYTDCAVPVAYCSSTFTKILRMLTTRHEHLRWSWCCHLTNTLRDWLVRHSPQNKITNTAGVDVTVSHSEPCQINDAVSLPRIIQLQMRGWENYHLILRMMSRLSPYDNDNHNHAKPHEADGR